MRWLSLTWFVLWAGCGDSHDSLPHGDDGGLDDASTMNADADVDAGEPTVCGGFDGRECGSGEFCDYDSRACGGDDGTGVCRPRTHDCPGGGMQVCGCDGTTYESACLANAAGTDAAYEGACEVQRHTCDPRHVMCTTPPPTCPAGRAAPIIMGCWGACLPIDYCTCGSDDECPRPDLHRCDLAGGYCVLRTS